MIKVLINAVVAKKKAGGGFQIALNFINHSFKYKQIDWCYFVSEELNDYIFCENKQLIKNENYYIFPNQPDFFHTYWHVKNNIKKIESVILPDLVYSILAPSYFSFRSVEVMRMTNPWVVCANKFALSTMSVSERIRMILYVANQKRLIRKRFYFITQSEAVKKGIMRITKLTNNNIRVVPNVLPVVFKNIVHIKKENISLFNIACVAALHPHKNIDIIPDILKILKNKYQISNIKFITTIPEESIFFYSFNKKLKMENLEANVVNKGYCTQEQLKELYKECDMCFFPSLLETFSATLLEAMSYSLPIVASNFEFNTEVAGNAGLYFNPKDAPDAAEKIWRIFSDPVLRKTLQNNAISRLSNFSDYDNHFKNTVAFFEEIIQKEK